MTPGRKEVKITYIRGYIGGNVMPSVMGMKRWRRSLLGCILRQFISRLRLYQIDLLGNLDLLQIMAYVSVLRKVRSSWSSLVKTREVKTLNRNTRKNPMCHEKNLRSFVLTF